MTDQHSLGDAPDERPPPSWYVFVLTILLLGVTALATVVVDRQLANRLGGYAVWALTAGVALRFAEYARLDVRVRAAGRRLHARLGTLLARLPVDGGPVTGTVRSGLSRVGAPVDRHGRQAGVGSDLRAGIRLAIPITLGVGSLLVGWWWLDPGRTVSAGFLVGWALAVLGLVWLGVLVRTGRQSS